MGIFNKGTNQTKYGKIHTSNPNRSKPDPKPHASKYSYDENGDKTTTHHYEGSEEYSFADKMWPDN